MSILSIPISLRLLRSGPHKDGRWINVIQWDASPDVNISFIVKRRYRHAPMDFGDGQTLGTVQSNYFIDFNPDVGKPTFYTIYPCIGKKIGHEEGCSIYAGLRPDEVSGLQAVRNDPSEVELMWKLPFHAVDCTVRKATSISKINRFKGATVVAEDIQSGAIDRNVDPNQHLYYVVFCTFYDSIKSAYVFSAGIQIHVLPYGERPVHSIDMIPQQIDWCAYCGGPLLSEEKKIICKNCNAPHHQYCWVDNKYVCSILRCGCSQYETVS